MADAKGEVVFDRPQGYKAGVYAVVVKGPKYFELIVNEPLVRMRTSAADLMGAMMVEKSQENNLFFGYIRFLNERKTQGDSLRTLLNDATDPLRRSVLKGRLEELDKEVRAYQTDLVAKAPGSLVAAIVRMSMPVGLEKPKVPDGRVDSIAAYYQYRAHYWDHVDLKDPRIIHTPVFQNKFDEYIGAVVPQIPDTIIKLADDLIGRLGPSEDLFRFVVHGITYKYETSDIMGMDAVFVHMALTYYCPLQEQLHVPMLLRFPGDTSRRDIRAPVQTFDLLPTVFAALGLEVPPGLDGRNLLPALRTGNFDPDRPIFAESDYRLFVHHRAVRQRSGKLIVDLRNGRRWRYDLAMDPGERAALPGVEERSPLAPLLEGWFKHTHTDPATFFLAQEAPIVLF